MGRVGLCGGAWQPVAIEGDRQAMGREHIMP
jgi:hypothetical protein